jgi:hypothetical protein
MTTTAEHGSPACKCGAPVFIKKTGECARCYQRRRRRELVGSPTAIAPRRPPRRSAAAQARVYAMTYQACHARLRAQRGLASQWTCVRCGRRAEEWAYRGGSPSEIEGDVHTRDKVRHMRWSPEPSDYDPMCRRCHGARDRDDYGRGYRHDPDKAREARRQWSAKHYAKTVATPEGRAAYRQRKQRERERRQRGEST